MMNKSLPELIILDQIRIDIKNLLENKKSRPFFFHVHFL